MKASTSMVRLKMLPMTVEILLKPEENRDTMPEIVLRVTSTRIRVVLLGLLAARIRSQPMSISKRKLIPVPMQSKMRT